MRRLCSFGIMVLFIFFGTAYGQSQFGQYTGVFQNDVTAKEQVAKLDFIVSKQETNNLRLMAILSVYFGDFSSQEYVTYHFDNVNYNILTGALVFDQPDQETTVVVDKFSGGVLDGRLRSNVAGNIGKLILKAGPTVTTTRPLVQPLWGEYKGMCNGYNTTIQVQTSRSSADTSRVGDPFGTYDITAQLAQDDLGCGDESSTCVWHTYSSGTYNFFKGTLNLYGNPNDQECKVTDTGLVCNGCDLRRVSKEAAVGNVFSLATTAPFWPPTPEPARDSPAVGGDVASIQGEYKGYIHHERLNVYQPASFNIVTYQQTGADSSNQLRLSAVGSIYFGDHGSDESIAYRFNERSYPLLSPQIVFERLDGDTDAIVQVTKIAGGEITGIWYSMLYGRVGTFTMKKDGLPTLPAGAQLMKKISGRYDSRDWDLTLRVARENTPINTRNPFFPLNFKGNFWMHSGATASLLITGGSYDFYTGKFTLSLGPTSLFAGTRPSNDKLLLNRPAPGIARPLQPHSPSVFNLRKETSK